MVAAPTDEIGTRSEQGENPAVPLRAGPQAAVHAPAVGATRPKRG